MSFEGGAFFSAVSEFFIKHADERTMAVAYFVFILCFGIGLLVYAYESVKWLVGAVWYYLKIIVVFIFAKLIRVILFACGSTIAIVLTYKLASVYIEAQCEWLLDVIYASIIQPVAAGVYVFIYNTANK